MDIQGKLHAILELQQISPTFRKREFVVEYADNPMYPQFVLFQLVQDRVDLISGYQVGDMIDVHFNLRGRQWTSPDGQVKYFNSLEAWRINPAQTQDPQQAGAPQAQSMPQQNTAGAASGPAIDVTQMEDDDDLPF